MSRPPPHVLPACALPGISPIGIAKVTLFPYLSPPPPKHNLSSGMRDRKVGGQHLFWSEISLLGLTDVLGAPQTGNVCRRFAFTERFRKQIGTSFKMY